MPSALQKTSRILPNYFSHYYENSIGPFVNLSDLSRENAEIQLKRIRQAGCTFASNRSDDYLKVRCELEMRVRDIFIQKGGKPKRARPHYMILGSCSWGFSWYIDAQELCIPLKNFSPEIISFTYGDTFPAMRYPDQKPYRGQVYCLDEIPELVLQFDLPQNWNPDGLHGPDRYIEAQVWDDEPLKDYFHKKG